MSRRRKNDDVQRPLRDFPGELIPYTEINTLASQLPVTLQIKETDNEILFIRSNFVVATVDKKYTDVVIFINSPTDAEYDIIKLLFPESGLFKPVGAN